MSENKIVVGCCIFFASLSIYFLAKDYTGISHSVPNSNEYKFNTNYDTAFIQDRDSLEWENLKRAIMKVESSDTEDTVNTNSGAVGVLQIMPVYVSEANRILGRKKFTLKDRLNKEASIEMFNIIQEHYNPEHNIHKAIKLHNPNGGIEYENKVLSELDV